MSKSTGPTQLQIFYQESRKIAESNEQFLEMVKYGMTRQDLEALIKKRPALWGRWENWLKKLPDATDITNGEKV